MLRTNRGFAALVSIILIGATLLALAAAGDLSGFTSRTAAMDHLYKTKSEALANACVATILSRLSNNALYQGGETISLGSDSCTIFPGASGDPRTFSIQAKYHHSYSNIKIIVDLSTLSVISRTEILTL